MAGAGIWKHGAKTLAKQAMKEGVNFLKNHGGFFRETFSLLKDDVVGLVKKSAPTSGARTSIKAVVNPLGDTPAGVGAPPPSRGGTTPVHASGGVLAPQDLDKLRYTNAWQSRYNAEIATRRTAMDALVNSGGSAKPLILEAADAADKAYPLIHKALNGEFTWDSIKAAAR